MPRYDHANPTGNFKNYVEATGPYKGKRPCSCATCKARRAAATK